MNEKKFSDLSFKDKIAYLTAIASFCLGWILICSGFIVNPLGEISSGVLTAFGSALVYTASVLGIALYFANELSVFKHSVDKQIRRHNRGHYNDFDEDEEDQNPDE